MNARRTVPTLLLAFVVLCSLASPALSQPSIQVNEFYRAGNLATTDEWVELVLRVPLTAAQLEGFYVGDSTGTTVAKFSGYKFTNMSSIAANFPAGTIIVVAGTTGPAADAAYNPGSGDWNITLKTAGANLTSNGSSGDFAGTDVAYVDTNGTNGDATLSSSGFAVNWHATPGAFGAIASVTIPAPANNTGAFLNAAVENATTAGNWSSGIALASLTPGQPNGGTNTSSINALRAAFSSTPSLNISDVTLAEGNPPGTTTFTFAVTLTAPAGPGGVTFDISTADNTAQDDNPVTEDNDYVALSLTGQSIPMGSTGPYNFAVTVNRDTTPEPNETFFVNVTNITGANAGDVQGTGTINNDDVSLTPIHDIQGPGASSPIVGSSVTTTGVVTGMKSNGFFIQEPDATVDADPATSEGVFVFTNAAPPVAAAVGNLVQVTGTVVEFVPSQDLLQPPLTEISSPTVVQLSTGNPLPAAIPLTATFPDPAGPQDQLERLEGMRVSVASLTASAPTEGNTNEPNATGTSTGTFYGTVTGLPRPFREPGIQSPDPAPSGSIPPIPRWDANPELLRVDSDGLTGGPTIDLATGAVVTGLVGPLDYAFRRYTILPDPGATIGVAGGITATSVTAPAAREFTVATYNLERFFDTVNDPAIGEPVLTATAFNNRLNKASLAIRNNLRMPDIIGIVEIENLSTLQSLATRISSDAIAAAQPDPEYDAYLVEGNDVGGIDVGFLVKTSIVSGATPRVEVVEVQQELDGTLFVNPDSSTETLNDRPPLRLNAIVHHANGGSFPVTVIVVHQRSLNGVDDTAAGGNGWPTAGARVRAKRLAQAEDLANLIQARQTASPTERIVIVGDYNVFEFNDGYVDAMNVVTGTPAPDNETAVPGDGVDLVNPDLDNLVDSPVPAERYSFVFGGNAQNLDHIVINQAITTATVSRRLEHARINADFPEVQRSNAASPNRLSDHDPGVAFFEVAAFASADLNITKTDNVDPVNAGQNFFYTITVNNNGPDPAETVAWSDPLPAGTTFVSLSSPGGWSCTTPAVGANGTVNCSIATLPVGSAAFTLTVAVDATLASGTVLSNTATVTSATADPSSGDLSATQTTTVATSADLLISKTDSPDPVNAGSDLTYQITLTNNGPSNATSASFSDTLPAGTTFVSLSTTGSWVCTTPAVGAAGTVSCTNASLPVTADFFTLVVEVTQNVPAGTVLSNTATLTSATTDPNSADNSATATTTVSTSADMQITKVDTPDPVTAGSNLTYTIGLSNAGPSDAVGASFSDTLPANTTFVSLTAFADFNCTTPAVGATGTISCTKPTPFLANSSGNFTLVVNVDPAVAAATVLSNTATITATTTDPTPGNNSATATTTVGTASADLSVTKTDTSDPVNAGTNLTYTITVTNAGPSNATTAQLADTLPAGTTFVSLSAPAGWSCTTPAVGATGTINCSNASLTAGNAVFTLVVNVDAGLASGTVLSNTATVSAATADANGANNSSTATTTVATSADVQITKIDTPDPVTAGTNLTYTITVSNAGPSTASTLAMNDTVPTGTTFVSLSSPAGWSCTTPAVGGTGAINCTAASLLAGGNAIFTLVVNASPSLTNGTILTNTATVSTTTTDPTPANNSATATTTVGIGSADLSVSKTDSPDPVNAGANLTWTITVNNAGPTNASSVSLSDTLPAGTTFVSLSAPGGWLCVTPAIGAGGTITCTIASLAPGNAIFTLVAAVGANTAPGTVITNTAVVSSTTADPTTGNESSTSTTNVLSPATLTATKTASGTFAPGSVVTYTVVVSNSGPSTQGDNAGAEFTDILPAGLDLVSATATSGTAVATVATNTVTWNGSLVAGATVTITIQATIDAAIGQSISNQGTLSYDADGNGTNEAAGTTDSPAQGGASDPTVFVVAPADAFATVPTLDEVALMALAAMLAAVAVLMMKR